MVIHIKKLIHSVLLLSLLLTITTVAAGAVGIEEYTDVPADHWGREAMAWAVENGVMKGTSSTTMEPERELTRAEFATMLQRLVLTDEQRRTIERENPGILNDPIWPEREMDYALESGLVDDAFNYIGLTTEWSRPTSRGEMATMIDNAMHILGEPEPDITGAEKYVPDLGPGGGGHKSLLRVYVAGIIVGVDEAGTFDGGRVVTRATAATVAQRLADPTKRQPLDMSGPPPEKPVDPTFVPRTFYEGDGQGQGLPVEGDHYIAKDGTEYVLEIDYATGVLGFGIPACDYYGQNVDARGSRCEIGRNCTSNFRGQSGALLQGPDGSVFSRNQWALIMVGTNPETDGTNEGQLTADQLWVWRTKFNEWLWNGPKL